MTREDVAGAALGQYCPDLTTRISILIVLSHAKLVRYSRNVTTTLHRAQPNRSKLHAIALKTQKVAYFRGHDAS